MTRGLSLLSAGGSLRWVVVVDALACVGMKRHVDTREPMSQEPEQRSFEEAFEVAERATQRLERGDLSLEGCLEEYEQGARALRDCYTILKSAQRRLEVLGKEVGLAEAESSVEERAAAWKVADPSGPLGDVLQRLKDDEGDLEG